MVGYVRLRHSQYRVDYMAGKREVTDENLLKMRYGIEDDGFFHDEADRMDYLKAAAKAIKSRIKYYAQHPRMEW